MSGRWCINHVAAIIVAVGSPTAVSAGEVGYYAQPALHGDRLIFSSEGDLWTATVPEAPEAGDNTVIVAHRITSSDGIEGDPRISPDGSLLAFTAEYDGNVDVYVMPIDGGAPTRLTFHPEADEAVAWAPDGRAVVFRSPRADPHGHAQLWRISPTGGAPTVFEFGECSMASFGATDRQIVFTRWSNEWWSWKRYRGGTAPEIWIGDLTANTFQNLTKHESNDQFPMWLRGRVFFLSDRSGAANIFSDTPFGNDLTQHTGFAPDAQAVTAIEGYDIRWPSADQQRRGRRIVFCQGAAIALLDVTDNTVRRLNVHLASDRVATRRRMAAPLDTATEYLLTTDADRILLGTRGDILSIPIEDGPILSLAATSRSREWGMGLFGADQLVVVSDITGEQQIGMLPADGSGGMSMLTEDREAWLFPPRGSPDGQWVAFADKTHRLYRFDLTTYREHLVDSSDAAEIVDYRFSPDSRWLAYAKTMANGQGKVFIASIRTGRTFQISDDLHSDTEPRWDPSGRYLYFLSQRHIDPVVGEIDFEHVHLGTTVVCTVPLAAGTPPPVRSIARSVGFDFENWATGALLDEDMEDINDALEALENAEPDAPPDADLADLAALAQDGWTMRVDTDGLQDRHYMLDIEADNIFHLEAMYGGVCYLTEPVMRLMDESLESEEPFGEGRATLHQYDLLYEEDVVLAEEIPDYAVSTYRDRLIYPTYTGFMVVDPAGIESDLEVDAFDAPLRVDVRAEWAQIFAEAWRLQRDFYWAPNHAGIDWDAIGVKYTALLPRIGTRDELNDLIGQMIGELRTSHAYVWGGDPHDGVDLVNVGMLGIDIEPTRGVIRIKRILPRFGWAESLESPLAASYLDVREGDIIEAVNGVPVDGQSNLYELLEGQAGRTIQLTLTDRIGSRERRVVEVTALESELPLRYTEWVERNRQYVHEQSDGRLGYLHIPDMMGPGLVVFNRYFYPQIEKKAIVIDVRNNGGGFVSQLIIQRLARKVWAFMQPRHGRPERYPFQSMHAHMAVIINEHAGSDGDIFPESFRIKQLGPLIGKRTWGGVVGIRSDKPFVDQGMSTQPEFAWWSPDRGWALENSGVSPDIEVDITPADRVAGRDPQLDKAIEVLLQMLEEDPKEFPPLPDWPDKGA